MPIRKLTSLVCLFLITLSTPALPSSSIPRKSPEFTINQPSGKPILLSSLKGKVVVLEFLFVRSPHCLQLADMLNRLNRDLGARGFQPIAVAFGPYADPAVLANLVEQFKLTYPVGYTSSDKVDAYLGREGKQLLKIPQMVVVDRQGVIRASSGSKGDPTLENEASLRALIDGLLRENSPVRDSAASTSNP